MPLLILILFSMYQLAKPTFISLGVVILRLDVTRCKDALGHQSSSYPVA